MYDGFSWSELLKPEQFSESPIMIRGENIKITVTVEAFDPYEPGTLNY